MISAHGVATDPEKIRAVQQWPRPQSVKDLHSFLGLAGYYRRFVQHFDIIARPLTDLLKKGVCFSWTEAHSLSFDALKAALSSAPVLALLDFSKPFCVETDASGIGMGRSLCRTSILSLTPARRLAPDPKAYPHTKKSTWQSCWTWSSGVLTYSTASFTSRWTRRASAS